MECKKHVVLNGLEVTRVKSSLNKEERTGKVERLWVEEEISSWQESGSYTCLNTEVWLYLVGMEKHIIIVDVEELRKQD